MSPGRDWEASHLDVAGLVRRGRRRSPGPSLIDEHGLELSALAYYENNLDARPRPAARRSTSTCDRCIDAAAAARVSAWSATFVGPRRDADRA